MSERRSLLILPAILLTLAAFFLPVLVFMVRSFSYPEWGLQNYREVWEDPVYLRVLWNTLEISGLVTFGCFILGYPLAHMIAGARPSLRRILVFVVLVPFWSSVLVRTFAWMVILQNRGVVNRALIALGAVDSPVHLIHNRIGVLIGMVQVLLPLMILPMYAVMSRIDGNYWDAASTLGASPVRNFLRVYFPMSLPGVAAGAVLVFIVSLGFYITPALLGGPGDTMISTLIVQQVGGLGNWGVGAALSCVLIGGVALTFLAAQIVGRSVQFKY